MGWETVSVCGYITSAIGFYYFVIRFEPYRPHAVSPLNNEHSNNMPNCPKCSKPVYFAERKTSLGKDWHGLCLKCEKCNKTLVPGQHAEHEGKPYCNNPCYSALFGPGGFGRGGAESYVYKK